MNKVRQADLANEARDMTKRLAAQAEKYQCAIVLGADGTIGLGTMNNANKVRIGGRK